MTWCLFGKFEITPAPLECLDGLRSAALEATPSGNFGDWRTTSLGSGEVYAINSTRRPTSCSRVASASPSSRLLGSHKYFAIFRRRSGARHGLCLHAQLSSSRAAGDSASRRGGKQLRGICQPGGCRHHDLNRDLLHSPSHRTPHPGALDVDWPHRGGRLRRCAQLLPQDETFPIAPEPQPWAVLRKVRHVPGI